MKRDVDRAKARDPVKRIDFKRAEDLLEALSPRKRPELSLDRTVATHEWAFRGQADARWRLIPSALRQASWPDFDALWGWAGMNGPNHRQIRLELQAVKAFALESDRQGLLVPSLDRALMNRSHFEELLEDIFVQVFDVGSTTFPPAHWEPMFGLAQHYGVPTRLLDWSESAYVAAYFAAVDAVSRLEKAERKTTTKRYINKRLAVWALDLGRVEGIRSEKYGSVHTVRAPWSGNPNLRAQKGLFTLHREDLSRRRPRILPKDRKYIVGSVARHALTKAKPLDRVIVDVLRHQLEIEWHVDYGQHEGGFLHMFTLPWKEARKLVEFLFVEDVSAFTLFPGYAGVVRGMRELRFQYEPFE